MVRTAAAYSSYVPRDRNEYMHSARMYPCKIPKHLSVCVWLRAHVRVPVRVGVRVLLYVHSACACLCAFARVYVRVRTCIYVYIVVRVCDKSQPWYSKPGFQIRLP